MFDDSEPCIETMRVVQRLGLTPLECSEQPHNFFLTSQRNDDPFDGALHSLLRNDLHNFHDFLSNLWHKDIHNLLHNSFLNALLRHKLNHLHRLLHCLDGWYLTLHQNWYINDPINVLDLWDLLLDFSWGSAAARSRQSMLCLTQPHWLDSHHT